MLQNLKWLEEYSNETIENIIDKSVIKTNGWFLYRSSKPNIPEYKITYMFNNNLENIINTLKNYNDIELIRLFSIRYNNDIESELKYNKDVIIYENKKLENKDIDIEYNNIEKVYNSGDNEKIRYILLNILNNDRADNYNDWINIGICLFNINRNYLYLWEEFSKRSYKYKKDECKKRWKTFKKNENGLNIGSLYYYSMIDNKEKIKDLNIIDTLNNIKNIFPNNDLSIKEIFRDNNYVLIDLLDKYCPIFGDNHDKDNIYMEMSVKGGIILKCKCKECRGKIYPNNSEINININDMKKIFNINIINNITNYNDVNNQENFLDYSNIIITDDKNLNDLLIESLNGINSTVYDIANVLYYLNKDNYRYDTFDKIWYYYDGIKWIKNNKLRSKISNEILHIYKNIKTIICKTIEEDKIKEKKLKKINYLLDNLKTTTFKNNIIVEASEIFNENCDNIIELLDANPYLLGFNNGIYDLKNNIFRESKHDDYISMTVGYNFDKINDEKMNKLLQFLEEILPDNTFRDYLLTYLSTCLIGINSLQHFVILLGAGRNGKSKFSELISFTLGDYYSSIKCKMLTKASPDSSAPDPMLLDLRKKRLVIASEPEKKEKLNTGYIKFLTGQDKIKTRNCHSNNMIEFMINFKIIMLCNDIPETDDNDEAYKRRVKCIKFPNQFVDNPIENYQKKIDYNLNIEEYKLELVHLLIQYYNKYLINGLPHNDIIVDYTTEINNNMNTCLLFMEQNTIESNTHLHTSKIYDKYKSWFKNNYPNDKLCSNKAFISNIKTKYHVYDNIRMPNVIYPTTGIKFIAFKPEITLDF